MLTRTLRQNLSNWTLALNAKPALPSWMPRMAFAPAGQAPKGDVLICVFQRGGMDGLNALVPFGDDNYFRARPTLAIQPPTNGVDKSAIALDNFFGLNPALRPLKQIWDAGQLAPIHAVGSPDPTHSHFDAMDFMERGTPGQKSVTSGWLGRHLASMNSTNASPLRAVGMGNMLQASLRGPVAATAFKSIADFHLRGRGKGKELELMQQTLMAMYGSPELNTPHGLAQTAKQINEIFDLLTRVNVVDYKPANNAQYPEGDFGMGLMQVAQLIKAEVGLEIACVDIGGWDTHANQEGQLSNLLAEFGQGLGALWSDLGVEKMKNVTMVTMSEFGRRVNENGSGGTDHGHANAMFVIGGNVAGGKVHADWPGLSKENLDGPGDLALTTDYRDVLSEIVSKRLKNPNVGEIFPDYSPKPRGIVKTE
jgi:uncharacterized protein (DUF1501 family)